MHEQLTHAAIAQWAREEADECRSAARHMYERDVERLQVDAARYDRIAAVFSALDVPKPTCSTCRFYGDVCYHGIGIPLAGSDTWGCTLHQPADVPQAQETPTPP